MTAFFERLYHKRHNTSNSTQQQRPPKGRSGCVRAKRNTNGRWKLESRQSLRTVAFGSNGRAKVKTSVPTTRFENTPGHRGTSASTEAFQEVQKAYRTLRLEIASPNNDAIAEISEDDESEEHDWR